MVLPDSLATVSLVAPLRPLCVCVIGLVRCGVVLNAHYLQPEALQIHFPWQYVLSEKGTRLMAMLGLRA